MTSRIAFALLALGVCAGDAHAGFRTTAWSFDTQTVPERQAELEMWITQIVQGPDNSAGTTDVLIAPVIGVTDQIEVSVPLTAGSSRASGTSQLTSWGAEGRWRLRKTGRIIPLIRVGARRLIVSDAFKLQGTLVLGLDPIPKLHVVINAGLYAVTKIDEVTAEYSGGALYAVTPDIRVGVDAYAAQDIKGPGELDRWVTAGPALTLSHGRFWIAASVPFGLTAKAPDAMPRLIWALAF